MEWNGMGLEELQEVPGEKMILARTHSPCRIEEMQKVLDCSQQPSLLSSKGICLSTESVSQTTKNDKATQTRSVEVYLDHLYQR